MSSSSSSSSVTCSGCGGPGGDLCTVCVGVRTSYERVLQSRQTLSARYLEIRRLREVAVEQARTTERESTERLERMHNALERTAAQQRSIRTARREVNSWTVHPRCGVCNERNQNCRPTGNSSAFVCPDCIDGCPEHTFCSMCGRWEETDDAERCGLCQLLATDEEEATDEAEPEPEVVHERPDGAASQSKLRCMRVTTVTVYDLTEECQLCMSDEYEGLVLRRCGVCTGRSCADCWEKSLQVAEDRVGERVCPYCRN